MSFKDGTRIILGELERTLGAVDEAAVERAIALIGDADKIFLHALGRAGFAGRSLVMRLMHMGREVYVLGETNTPNFGPDDLLIICSGSGATKQFVDTATKAKGFGGKVLLFTATKDSPLGQIADAEIVIEAPSKRQSDSEFASIQPMASLFEQSILLIGDAMVLAMMERSVTGEAMFRRHSNLE
ncbi:6-phospho-3-hexuloisomerase [Bifidobacterium samirii]|uniref:6-phospho-3-hexuloisomerase n=2 Tax=Bifidobacterium samirii TaxID=2306974 RepID=A0A430FP95_9BIFI|nr:6-phospho-3-hexuloisomerase [Bifidobacterium samirii]